MTEDVKSQLMEIMNGLQQMQKQATALSEGIFSLQEKVGAQLDALPEEELDGFEASQLTWQWQQLDSLFWQLRSMCGEPARTTETLLKGF